MRSQWVCVLRKGDCYGHTWDGIGFVGGRTVADEDLLCHVANGTPVDGRCSEPGDAWGVPACGWVRESIVRDGGLWVRIEWNTEPPSNSHVVPTLRLGHVNIDRVVSLMPTDFPLNPGTGALQASKSAV